MVNESEKRALCLCGGSGSSSTEFGGVLERLCVSDVSIAVFSSSLMMLRGIQVGIGILVSGDSASSTYLTPSITFWPIPCFGVVGGAQNYWMSV